jgi:RNA polymerase sigma factor (sigma-70 family)
MAQLSLTSPLMDDESALIRAAQHDPAAFAPVYERYVGRIYGYCLRHLTDPAEAEDLTSAIFMQVLRNLRGYRGGSVTAWLFRIAHNALMSHFRKHRTRASYQPERIDQPDAPDQYALANLIQGERQARLQEAVAALPLEQRELLALRVDGNLSAKEIGAIIGKREGAVRVALHRIMQQLRAELSAGEHDDER